MLRHVYCAMFIPILAHVLPSFHRFLGAFFVHPVTLRCTSSPLPGVALGSPPSPLCPSRSAALRAAAAGGSGPSRGASTGPGKQKGIPSGWMILVIKMSIFWGV